MPDNPYDALRQAREALAECICQIEYLHNKFHQTGSGNATIAHASGVFTSIDAALAGEGAATPVLITFQPMRPIGCPRGPACSGQTISFGDGKQANTCGLAGCQHNYNPTHGGCGVDRVHPTQAIGRGK